MRRVSLVGNAGSGKSTIGRTVADRLGVPFIELDSVFHQPGWEPLPRDEFRARVGELIAADGWVIDGNYSAVRDIVWARADTVVFIDLPRWLNMYQVITRTLRRTMTRQELWNGNREPPTALFRLDPEHNIVRLAWVKHATYRKRYPAAAAEPANAHLTFVRLTSRRAVDRFVAGVAGQHSGGEVEGDHRA